MPSPPRAGAGSNGPDLFRTPRICRRFRLRGRFSGRRPSRTDEREISRSPRRHARTCLSHPIQNMPAIPPPRPIFGPSAVSYRREGDQSLAAPARTCLPHVPACPIRSVAVGDRLAAQPADDQRAVELAEVPPGSLVAGLGTNQQARSGLFHRRPPRSGRPPVRPAGTPRLFHYRPIP